MFEIGDKVVCVDDSPSMIGLVPITKGQIYVIRGLDTRWCINSELGLRLIGIRMPNWYDGTEMSFRSSRFRKLEDLQNEARQKKIKKKVDEVLV